MLLRKKFKAMKIDVRKLFEINNSFFIFFNCNNEDVIFLKQYFGFGKVVHVSCIKNMKELYTSYNMFAGNSYFCFFDKIDFFFNYNFFLIKHYDRFFLKLNYFCYDSFFLNPLQNLIVYHNYLYFYNFFFIIFIINIINYFFIFLFGCLSNCIVKRS